MIDHIGTRKRCYLSLFSCLKASGNERNTKARDYTCVLASLPCSMLLLVRVLCEVALFEFWFCSRKVGRWCLKSGSQTAAIFAPVIAPSVTEGRQLRRKILRWTAREILLLESRGAENWFICATATHSPNLHPCGGMVITIEPAENVTGRRQWRSAVIHRPRISCYAITTKVSSCFGTASVTTWSPFC